jgi:hypothetical protein
MNQYGRVKYYDPEDVGLLRLRQQRAPAHHHHGPQRDAPQPPVAESAAASESDDEVLDDRGDRDEEARVAAVQREFAEATAAARAAEVAARGVARGVVHQSCAPAPSASRPARAVPRSPSGVDLTSLDLVEFAAWCALVYLPARFAGWISRRRAAARD